MSIKWFPGHMIAARKKAAESMRMTDLVIEVLDARVPRSSTRIPCCRGVRGNAATSGAHPVW
jgi:ribosome biogenesis GTPase A